MKNNKTLKFLYLAAMLATVITVIVITSLSSVAVTTVKVDSYETLKSALDDASAGTRVIILSDITVPSGSTLSVPSGVRLILACCDDGSYGGNESEDYLNSNTHESELYYTNSTSSDNAKYTLTVEKGAQINVYGSLYIGGKLTAFKQVEDVISFGNTSNVYSRAIVDGKIDIIGGSLYTYGYIEGSGSVECRDSGNIYSPFVICGFRFGSYYYGLYDIASESPLNEYTLPNIKCVTSVYYGANLYGMAAAFSGDTVVTCMVKMIGASNSFLIFNSVDSIVSICYQEAADSSIRYGKTVFSMNGDINSGAIVMDILYNTVTTENIVFPLCHGIEFDIVSGSFALAHSFALLPGAKITVENDAELIITENGMLLLSEGCCDTAIRSRRYPSADELIANGNSTYGELSLKGTMVVEQNGTFAGTVGEVSGGKIVIENGAKLSGTLTMGMSESFSVNFKDYEYYNKTTYELKARALGIDGKLFELEAGNEYYSAVSDTGFLIDSYTYTYYGTKKNDTPRTMNASTVFNVRGSVNKRGILFTFENGNTVYTEASSLLPLPDGHYWYYTLSGQIVDEISDDNSFNMLTECDRKIDIISQGACTAYALKDGKLLCSLPQREHYELLGFSSALDNEAEYSEIDIIPEGISTLYAVWDAKEYQVNYLLDEQNYAIFGGGYEKKIGNYYLIAVLPVKYGEKTDFTFLNEQMAVNEYYFEWQAKQIVDSDINVFGVYFEYGIRNLTTGAIHPTLSAAIQKAQNGDVLRLQSDVTEAVTVPSGLEIIIDINGYSISYDSDSVIVNSGVLTLTDGKGDGTISQTGKGVSGSSAYYAVKNDIGAVLTIDGVSIVADSESTNTRAIYNRGTAYFISGKIMSSGGYAVYNYGSKAQFVQSGGITEFSGTSSSSYAVYNYNLASYKLTGGKIIALGSAKSFCNYLKSELTVEGGEISSETGGALFNNGGYADISGGRISTGGMSSQVYAIQCTKTSNVVPKLNVYGGEIVASSGSRAIYNYNGLVNVYGGYIAAQGNSTSAWAIYNYYLSTLNIYGGEIYSKRSHTVNNQSASSSNVPDVNVYGGILRSDAGGSYYALNNADGSKYGRATVWGGSFISNGKYAVYSGSEASKIAVNATAAGGEYKYSTAPFYNYTDNTGGFEMSLCGNGETSIMVLPSTQYTVSADGKEYRYISQAISEGCVEIVLTKDAVLNYPVSADKLVIDLAGNSLCLGANTMNFGELILKDSVGGGKLEGMTAENFSSLLNKYGIKLGELWRENDLFLGYSPDGGTNFYTSIPERGVLTLYPVFASEAEFTVVFRNYDGTVISQNTYSYGETVIIPSAPERQENEVFSYSFVGWSEKVEVVCRENADYTALFDEQYKKYKVTFESFDGTILSELSYHYGQCISYIPKSPQKPMELTHRFEFIAWMDENGNECSEEYTVSENTVFKASYAQIDYTDSYENGKVAFNSATVVFESAMAINFRAIYEDFADFEMVYAVIEKHSQDGSVQSVILDDYTHNGDYMVFAFNGISAKEMGDKVTATLYAVSGNTRFCSKTVTYGIRIYAERMLAKETTSTEFRRLLISMLDYGACAQIYFGYNTSDLVNSSITQQMRPSGMYDGGYIELNSVTDYKKTGEEKVSFRSASLLFIQNIAIMYQMDLSQYTQDKNDLTLVLTYTDIKGNKCTQVCDFSEMKLNGAYYTASFDCIPIKDLSITVTTEIYEKYYEPENRQSVGGVLTYSIESYAASKQNSVTPGLSDLVKYMMAFSREAQSYFAQ